MLDDECGFCVNMPKIAKECISSILLLTTPLPSSSRLSKFLPCPSTGYHRLIILHSRENGRRYRPRLLNRSEMNQSALPIIHGRFMIAATTTTSCV